MFWTQAFLSSKSAWPARWARRAASRAAASRPSFRPIRFEPLEDRMMLSGGIVTTSFGSGTWAEGCASLLTGDKIVVAGKVFPPMQFYPLPDIYDYWSTIENIALARYDTNGALDSTFGNNGVVATPISGGEAARAIAAYGSDQFVVAGYGSMSRTTPPNYLVARYDDIGALDTQFCGGRKDAPGTVQTDLGSRETLQAVLVQPDGKTVAAGMGFHLARYLPNGPLDTGFGINGIVEPPAEGYPWHEITAMAFHEGKILVVGYTWHTDTDRRDIVLARYDTDGHLDPGFAAGQGFVVMTDVPGSYTPRAMQIDASGRIVVAGDDFVARFDATGTPDTSFGGGFVECSVTAYSVVIDNNDKILVAGRAPGAVFGLARYDAFGIPDASFGTSGTVLTRIGTDAGVRSVVMQGGKIVASGWADTGSGRVIALARYDNSGALDTTFGPESSLSISDVSKSEGNGGTSEPTEFSFEIALSSPSAADVTVDYSVSGGTATAGSDYLAVTGTLEIPAGAISETVTVSVYGDKLKEANETFYVKLANSNGPVIADDTGVGTIINDDKVTRLTAAAFGQGTSNTLAAPVNSALVTEAIARWKAGGADTSTLENLDIRFADFADMTLGEVIGQTIWIDSDAAGWGWFVDSTPSDDRKFALPGDQGEQDRIDLLTVVMHEMGHLLGYEHEDDGVMAETLAAGVRRTDVQHDHAASVDNVFRQAGSEHADSWLGLWLFEQLASKRSSAKRRR